jgi:hypothetical protein
VVVDVAAVWERKVAAALCHASQFPQGRADLDWMERRDRAAAQAAGGDLELAETYRIMAVW